MAGRLDGKVAVITGGASGMGKATAERFLAEGARVVIGDLNEESGARAVAELRAAGHGDAARFVPCNVAEEADVKALVEAAVDAFGGLDCMFNNAGIGGAFGPIADTKVEEWDMTFAVLVRGVFLGMKHSVPVLKRQGRGGSILSTSSMAAFAGLAGPHAYSAAKAAVANLTRCVAAELAPDRIRVNAIAPGVIETPLFHGGAPDKAIQRARSKMAWPRLGRPGDIAGAALYLASDDAEYVSGHVLTVDGGFTAQGTGLWDFGPEGAMFRKAGINFGSTGEAMRVRDPGEGGN